MYENTNDKIIDNKKIMSNVTSSFNKSLMPSTLAPASAGIDK